MNILKDAFVQIIKDNKLFLVNDNTFICIKFKDDFKCDILKTPRGVVEKVYHINNDIPFTHNQNKFTQMVIGKVVKGIRYTIKGKFNTIELNDSTCILYTSLNKYYSPVAVATSILDDATFLNLLIYYNEKYKSFFNLNFDDKTFNKIVLKKYFALPKSTKSPKFDVDYKKIGNINDIDLEHLSSVYPMYINKILTNQDKGNTMPVVKSSKSVENKLSLEEIYNLFVKYTKENMEIKINNVKVTDIAYTETINKVKCLVLLTYNGYVVYNNPGQITQMKAIPKEIQLL